MGTLIVFSKGWFCMRLHCSSNVCVRLLTAGWKFRYWRSRSHPRPCILGQFSMPHIGFCPACVSAFPKLEEGGDLLWLVHKERAVIVSNLLVLSWDGWFQDDSSIRGNMLLLINIIINLLNKNVENTTALKT